MSAAALPIGDMLIALALLAFFVLFAVYAWTDLGELIDEQVRLDAMWIDEPRAVSPRPAATDAGGLGDAA